MRYNDAVRVKSKFKYQLYYSRTIHCAFLIHNAWLLPGTNWFPQNLTLIVIRIVKMKERSKFLAIHTRSLSVWGIQRTHIATRLERVKCILHFRDRFELVVSRRPKVVRYVRGRGRKERFDAIAITSSGSLLFVQLVTSRAAHYLTKH